MSPPATSRFRRAIYGTVPAVGPMRTERQRPLLLEVLPPDWSPKVPPDADVSSSSGMKRTAICMRRVKPKYSGGIVVETLFPTRSREILVKFQVDSLERRPQTEDEECREYHLISWTTSLTHLIRVIKCNLLGQRMDAYEAQSELICRNSSSYRRRNWNDEIRSRVLWLLK